MPSLDLPPPDFAAKTAIFRSSQSANFVKNFVTNPEVCQFRQKSIFSSRWPVFVVLSVFRQKRNPLESNNDADLTQLTVNSMHTTAAC